VRREGAYSFDTVNNALHTAQCVVEHSLMPHVRNLLWHMNEWKFRPRNRTIYCRLQGNCELWIITSDKLCKFYNCPCI